MRSVEKYLASNVMVQCDLEFGPSEYIATVTEVARPFSASCPVSLFCPLARVTNSFVGSAFGSASNSTTIMMAAPQLQILFVRFLWTLTTGQNKGFPGSIGCPLSNWGICRLHPEFKLTVAGSLVCWSVQPCCVCHQKHQKQYFTHASRCHGSCGVRHRFTCKQNRGQQSLLETSALVHASIK